MNPTKKLIIASLVMFNTTAIFGMRPRGSSTRPPAMLSQESPLQGMAATVAPVQSTEHKPRVWLSTMESQPDSLVDLEVPSIPYEQQRLFETTSSVNPILEEQDEQITPTEENFKKLEAIDRSLLERILNPNPKISNPVDVNDPIIIDPSEMQVITPLGLASFWGLDAIIDKLCSQGALVNEPMPTNTLPDLEGFTPLHIAVMFNKIPAA